MSQTVEERVSAALERRAERRRQSGLRNDSYAQEVTRERLQRCAWQNEFIGPRRELLESAAERLNRTLEPRGYHLRLTDRARMPPYGTRIFGFQVQSTAGEAVNDSMLRFRLNNLGQVLITVAHPLHFEAEPIGERIVALPELTAELAAEVFADFVAFVLDR